MRKHNLNELIEYKDNAFYPKVLINEPGYRILLLSMRAGQAVPEHSTPEPVTVYAIRGHVTFYEGPVGCELRTGEVVSVDSGRPHRVDAHEDSALLVVAAGKPQVTSDRISELDLRDVARPFRHPLVFQTFDGLGLRDVFDLITDHDPMPLHTQMDATRPGQANWAYIERGPDVFRIRIRRIALAGRPAPGHPVAPFASQ